MSSAVATTPLAAELAAIVGDAHVTAASVDAGDPARAFAIDGIIPSVVVAPGCAEEVAAVVRCAVEHRAHIVPAGGLSAQSFGAPPAPGFILLRTARLKAVEHYDPGDLTIGLGAGTTLAELDALIAPHRQLLPLDCARPELATVGGVLARAAHGPMKHGYGGLRDYCIGVRFVTGDGKLAKGGGRVVKNVAGYDLMKLLLGSFGTLGIITSASFKLVPRPRQTLTFAAGFATAAGALLFRDRVLASPLAPMCLEVVSPHAHEFLREKTEARDPDHFHADAPVAASTWSVLLRAAGSDAVLARYRRELREMPADCLDEISGADEETLWRYAANFASSVVARHQNAMIVQVGSAIQDVAAALAALDRAALDYNFIPAVVGRCGIGSLVAAFMPLATDPPSAMNYAAAISALRAGLPAGASAVVARCPREAKPHFSLWGEPNDDVASMKAVKRALDPLDVLNRGRSVV